MTLVALLESNSTGTKFEVYQMGENSYSFTYFEKFKSLGWREVFTETNYTREAIEDHFDIDLDNI